MSNILGIETVKETLEKVSIQQGLTNIRVGFVNRENQPCTNNFEIYLEEWQ